MLTEKLGQLLAGAAMLLVLALLLFAFSTYAPSQGGQQAGFAAQKGATPLMTEQAVVTPSTQSTASSATPSNGPHLVAPEELATIVALHPEPTKNSEEIEQMHNDDLMRSLYDKKGVVIAQGTNQKPTGRWSITTYRLEEVNLSEPVSVKIVNKNIAVTQYWSLTIEGTFGALNSLPEIQIDGVAVGYGTFGLGVGGTRTLIFDGSLLKEGGVITVMYGGETTLPDRLHVGKAENK